MSKVRVLVGTKKGAFILTADGARKNWEITGPHFAGWEIYHLKGSPADPNRIYASQSSGWFGQIIQRSDDGGKTWNTPGSSPEELKSPDGMMPKGESNKFVYEGQVGTHKWYDGTQHPWEFKRVWHLEPSLRRSGHGLRRRGRRGDFQDHRRRQNVEGTLRFARRERSFVAARRGRHGGAHDHARSEKIRIAFTSPSRRRARSAPMTEAKPGSRSIVD